MTVTTGTVRVLIVDDQETFRSAARLVVELADGFELAGEAATGEEAVELTRSLEPHLVLMDINMPGIDGLEATRRIVGERPEISVIVLSTYEAAEYESTALEAGARAFLSKSDFGPEALVEVWNTP